MDELIKELRANTEAVTRLASATMQLVQYMAEADGEGEEVEPATYMDGTPVMSLNPAAR